jgi:hypothetical protein
MGDVKHTPGPWRVHVEPGSGPSWSSDSVFVCGAGSWPEEQISRVNVQDGLGEREANARLIAASPDLLEALESIFALGSDGEHSGDRHARCRDIARAAIAKATGSDQ